MRSSNSELKYLSEVFVKPRWLNTLVGMVLVVSLIGKLFSVFYNCYFNIDSDINNYGFTEYLINFEGGFVRRGLLGQLLFYISKITGINPIDCIITICCLSYSLTFIFFWKEFKKHDCCWWLIFTTFLCASTSSFIRKDYLLFCLFIATAFILKNKIIDTKRIIIVCLLTTFGLCIHEAYLFWAVPIIFFIFYAKYEKKYVIIISLIIIIIEAIFLIINKGNADIAQHIRNSWNNDIFHHDLLIDLRHNSIGALEWDVKNTFIYHLNSNFPRKDFGVTIYFIRAISYILVYYFITNFIFVFKNKFNEKDIKCHKLFLSVIYIFVTIGMIPMFTILSCDWGRLFQYITIVSFVIFFLFPSGLILKNIPEKFILIVDKLNGILKKILIPTKGLFVFLLLCLSITPVGFDHGLAVHDSPLGSFCNNLYCIFHLIYKCIETQ